jgi:ADP-ribose pyrophosphatase YjhB (NUDIX family)
MAPPNAMDLRYSRNPLWTHGGGVVCRGGRDAPEILLVRAQPAPHDWVLPKGHLEPGEVPHECARREVGEEAGVAAEPIAFAGDDMFTTPAGKRVHVAFFVLKFVDLGSGRRGTRGPLVLVTGSTGAAAIRRRTPDHSRSREHLE